MECYTNMNKKRITYILTATLTVLVLYISYFGIYGVSKGIHVQNDYGCFTERCKFRMVDFTVLVNGDTVFSDAVESNHNFGKLAEATFRFGWNRIEVFSDSTSLYTAKKEFIIFPTKRHVVFGQTSHTVFGKINGGRYHNIFIY